MAWYLSEAITDLSQLSSILEICSRVEKGREADFSNKYYIEIQKYLRTSSINLDHIEYDSIPEEYGLDEFKWLSKDYLEMIEKLGFLTIECEGESGDYGFELTEEGGRILSGSVTVVEAMRVSLRKWKNSNGRAPYQITLDLLSKLKHSNLYPCDGLLLLEVLHVLLKLNEESINLDPYNIVHEKRKAYYSHMTGDIRVDIVQYSDYLWEQMCQDLFYYHAANYPARSTLLLMMYGEEIVFGRVPDDMFGLVQFVTISDELRDA